MYRPLVIDRGTTPAIAPVSPNLPANAQVAVLFGFQGTILTLAHAPTCVNGFFRNPFGQVAYCGAPAFFAAARNAIAAGLLQIPPLGTGMDGQPCPTTRDFSVVDQDQSDNVDTSYLAFPDGRTAQVTGGPIPNGAMVINNGSDNRLLDTFIDPALGCTPFTAPDLTAGGQLTSTGTLNELQATLQQAPVALVPPNDPMVLVNNQKSIAKTNLYRLGVGQPFTNVDTSFDYCTNLAQIAPARQAQDQQFFVGKLSPTMGMDLAAFLKDRLQMSLTNLQCNQQRQRNNFNFFGGNR